MVERDPQALLAAYRSGLGPSRAVEERMLASLRSEIAAAPEPSGAGPAAAATTAKLATVVLVGSIAVAAVLAAIDRDEPAPTRAPVTEIEPRPVESAPPQSSVSLEAAPPDQPTLRAEPAPPQPRTRPRRRARAREPELTSNLAEEAKLLRSVDAAVRKRDFAAAHAQLDAYHSDFATGSLRAQADELALLLACAEDPDGASQRASEHLQAHPNSRARARIEDACGLR